MISYQDFDLRFWADGSEFRISAEREGQKITEHFVFEGSDSWSLDQLRKSGRDTIRECGATLFDALLRGSIRGLYEKARDSADGNGGLRIRLQFDPRDQRLRTLLRLPWEIVFDRSAYRSNALALDRHRPLVRIIDSKEVGEAHSGRIDRILLALATSGGERHYKRETKAFARARISPAVLANLTRNALFDALMSDEPQAVHLVGRFTGGTASVDAALVLTDEYGVEDRITASELAACFAGRRRPQLVTLYGCGSDPDDSALIAIAVALAAAGLPAVISVQAETLGRAAPQFTSMLHQRLYFGDPVEAAMAEARNAIGGKLAWASPLLFMSSERRRVELPALACAGTTVTTARVTEQFNTNKVGTQNFYFSAEERTAEKAAWQSSMQQAADARQYNEVIRLARNLAIGTLTAPELDMVECLLLELLESSSETGPAGGLIDVLHRIHRAIQAAGVTDDVKWSRRTTRMLIEEARRTAAQNPHAGLSAYDEIYTRFRDYPDRIVQDDVNRALDASLDLGWRVLRDPNVDAVANLILARHARSLASSDGVARAMLVKAEIRLEASQFSEALHLLDEVIAAGSWADILPRARVRRASALAGFGLQRIEAALAQAAEVTESPTALQFRHAATTLEAYTIEAWLLESAGRGDEALDSLDRACRLLSDAFGGSSPVTARARLTKALTAERLGQRDIAIAAYEQICNSMTSTETPEPYTWHAASQARLALQRLRDSGGNRSKENNMVHQRLAELAGELLSIAPPAIDSAVGAICTTVASRKLDGTLAVAVDGLSAEDLRELPLNFELSSFQEISKQPHRALTARLLIGVFDATRLITREDVELVENLFFIRPRGTYAFIFVGISPLDGAENLERALRSGWRLLVPEPKPRWMHQNLAEHDVFVFGSAADVDSLDGLFEEARRGLKRLSDGIGAADDALARTALLYAVDSALTTSAQQATSTPPADDRLHEVRYRDTARDEIAGLRTRLIRRLDSEAAALHRIMDTAVIRLRQDLVSGLEGALRDGDGKSLPTRASLGRSFRRFINTTVDRAVRTARQEIESRTREIERELTAIIHNTDWSSVQKIRGDQQPYPEALLDVLHRSVAPVASIETTPSRDLPQQPVFGLPQAGLMVLGSGVVYAVTALVGGIPAVITSVLLGASGLAIYREQGVRHYKDHGQGVIRGVTEQIRLQIEETIDSFAQQLRAALKGALQKIVDEMATPAEAPSTRVSDASSLSALRDEIAAVDLIALAEA